ncbi:hypothetical protein GIB67_023730 [Kingdonia uniflora]|uniref:Uncharacterized protein n=1 Tax=Kingdonia uniflora TaxID=39325 RepID=A0A7J7MGA8_9MAGN|nr:hypothetical protein GIB67_023730 [Kingdonia uniflora]
MINVKGVLEDPTEVTGQQALGEGLPVFGLEPIKSRRSEGDTAIFSLCKYLMVASGRASVFIMRAKAHTAIKAWDHAVGVICVHEAGGQVTDWEGIELDLAGDQRAIFPSVGVLVTNGNLHNHILGMISANSSLI